MTLGGMKAGDEAAPKFRIRSILRRIHGSRLASSDPDLEIGG